MTERASKPSWRTLAVLAIFLLIVIVSWKPVIQHWLLTQTRQAIANRDHERALQSATKLLSYEPDSIEARRAAIRAAHSLGRPEEALPHLRWFESIGKLSAEDCALMGEITQQLAMAAESERYLKLALQLDPDLNLARARLIDLLATQCRTYESVTQRRYLLRRGGGTAEDLLYLAKPEDLIDSPDLDLYLAQDPDNAHLLLAKSRLARLLHRYVEAHGWLDRALSADSSLLEAHADRGLLLVEEGDPDEAFVTWDDRLPDNASQHPDIWFVRGMWARDRGDLQGAVRCFGETLVRDHHHRSATHQLAMALATIGEDALSAKLSARVTLFDELNRAVDDIYDTPESLRHKERAAGLLESLGRLNEAAAWYLLIATLDHSNTEARDQAEELVQQSRDELEPNPIDELDLAAYAVPSFVAHPAAQMSSRPVRSSSIRFANVASQLGLDFSFVGADKPVRRTRYLYEIFGAGTAAFDFDRDGWPDIFCGQGTSSEDVGNATLQDELFWNREGKQFKSITTSAFLGESGFSQGVSVGDFNNDGFPDLLIACVGENRLYRNNGDGTFQDVTALAGITGSAWTSSCAIADVNGDGNPDIYEVNYLGGDDVLRVRCDGPGRTLDHSCRPRDFPSEPDRLLLSNGDGRFTDHTASSDCVAPGGKGLGVIVADFEGNGLLSLFVANDTTSNHFYVNRSARGTTPNFDNRAAPAGVAVDQNGLTQACMGVAVDDVNADGQLDLFITNFFDESNTLYRGMGRLFFEDASRAAGLHQPSLPLLGFGTQFIDAELDGDPDIVVTNGHITSESVDGASFQMRSQFFENRGGKFFEHVGLSVGDYFAIPVLGRALARLDFDRDGLEDIIVTHLDAPTALLQNETDDAGHYLSVQLVGVTCERDAIGASVTVETSSGLTRTRQMTAGDGYQSTNQRQLMFGLNDDTQVTKLLVRWPSGAVQTFENLDADSEVVIIEGSTLVAQLAK